MKKNVIALLLIALFSQNVIAQQNNGSSSENKNFAQPGDHMINLYYGVRIINAVYRSVASSNAINTSFRSFGPVGLVYEYVVAEGVGLGVELSYAATVFKFSEKVQVGNKMEEYNYEFNTTSIRAMMRANFHFVKSDKFDAYALVSAGYRNTTYSYRTSDPTGQTNGSVPSFIPFGFKPGLGVRYFFAKNFGIQAEFALGTPILSGGLCFKI